MLPKIQCFVCTAMGEKEAAVTLFKGTLLCAGHAATICSGVSPADMLR